MKSTNKKLNLPNVTLVAVSSININETIKAIENSYKDIHFGAVKLITHEMPEQLPQNISFEKCDKIKSIDEYSYFMLYKLTNYIDTDFALIVQHDGFVLNTSKWSNEFFEYDYIGAPWPRSGWNEYEGNYYIVGNGGFSLRSKKLLDAWSKFKIPFDPEKFCVNEDYLICVRFRDLLSKEGVSFATPSLASKFSREHYLKNFYDKNSFGFHKLKYDSKYKYMLRNVKHYTKFLSVKIKSTLKNIIKKILKNEFNKL